MKSRFTLTVSAFLASAMATAAPAAPLVPVDQWNLDYGDTQCVAARSFGDAAGPTVLGIVPSLNSAYYKVMVSVPRSGPSFARESRGSVDFGRGPIGAELLYYGQSGVKQSVTQFDLSAADMAQAAAASAMTLKTDHGNYSFTLSGMPQLISLLRKCNASLRQDWNVGAAAVPEPVADIRSLLKRKDYPTEAIRMKPLSSLQYQLLIDEKGAVAGCEAVVPSGAQVLDTTGCQVIAGGTKFRPVTDASGKPMRSAWTTPPLVWTSGVESALDSGCTRLSSDSRTLVNMCAQSDNARIPTAGSPPPPPR